MSLSPGDRLGPYEIVGPLGSGGMGEVYRARDPRLRREVALKILRPSLPAEHLERLGREARAAGGLNHPNIVAVFDVGTEGGVPYIVSELLEGESLRERLDRGRLSYHKALEYGIQIALALAAAHVKGIWHRDVKPPNVFITTDGRVKLLDFGLAKVREPEVSTGPEDPTVDESRPGVVLGTVGYMAPEQVLGWRVDHRADLFALGAVLYEMFTAARAFHRDSAVETMNAVLKEDPVDPLALNTSLPQAAAAVVRRCLEKNREERFQSARDLAFQLQQLEQATTGVQPRVTPHVTVRRRLLAVGLAVTIVAGAMWLLRRIVSTQPAPMVSLPPAPTYQQLSFRRGRITGARFTAAGIVYSQAVGAHTPNAPDVSWIQSLDRPESGPVDYSKADVLAVRGGDVALRIDRRFVRGERFVGTLAVAPLAGSGEPKEMVKDVEDADWHPSGDFAVARSERDGDSSWIEYPRGNKLYETSAGSIHSLRISPDGQRVAFLEDPTKTGTRGNVHVVDSKGKHTKLTDGLTSARGLAWSPGGNEVWLTAAETRDKRALRAVDLEKKTRVVLDAPGSLTLWDVDPKDPNGRVLLTRDEDRMVVTGVPPGETSERDFSLFDSTGLASLSRDGRYLLLGDRFGKYRVSTDGRSRRKRLPLEEETYADDLSPDNNLVLVTAASRDHLILLPMAAGDAKPLPSHGIQSYSNARWFPDNERILFTGEERGRKPCSYVTTLSGGRPKRLTPEGAWALSISKDGKWVAAMDEGGISRFPVPVGGGEPGERRPVPGSARGDRPVAWSEDSQWLWVFRRGEVPAQVDRLEIATGHRQHKMKLSPPDPVGVFTITEFRVTPTGNAYAYSYRRVLSELYVVSGLQSR